MTIIISTSDRALVAAWAHERDARALTKFVERHQQSVLRVAETLVGRGDLAQDVAQETFLEVARRPARILDVQCYRSWLLKVARNKGLDMLRARARTERHEDLARRGRPERATEPEPLQALAVDEERARVRAAIAALPARQREVLVLRMQEHRSYREIAEITGLTATNVGYILHHAVKALGRVLAPEAGGSRT